jgi:tetratricopeptide (TPR) repeat protein
MTKPGFFTCRIFPDSITCERPVFFAIPPDSLNIGILLYERSDNQDLTQLIRHKVQRGSCPMEWLYSKGIPIEAQYLYRKAFVMAGQGQDESALKYYRQALIIAPRYSKAVYEMGNCLAHLGRYAEAVSMYDRAIHLNPEDPEIKKRRDGILSGNGKD